MGQSLRSLDEVLEVLHQQGSRLISREALAEHTTLVADYEYDGEAYPCVVMANGVRWFYNRDLRPPGKSGPKKALAPEGIPRQLLGSIIAGHDPVLFEGERDWLTALSLGLTSALCVGGVTNLDEAQVAMLAPCANIVLMFDNDDPGRRGADLLAAQLVEAGCRTVKLARIPLADADFSDWAESLPSDRALEIVLSSLQHADKIGKREAKRIRKEQQTEHAGPVEKDEFLIDGTDLVVAIWKPGDPLHPNIDGLPGHAMFAHFDRAATTRNKMLVVNELSRWEEPEHAAEHDQPNMYGGQTKSHLQERPPVIVPLSGDTFQKRIIVVPSGAKEHISSEQLFDELVHVIDDYFVVDPRFIRAMAAYTMMTYRYRDAGYEVVPYIRVVGQAGKGKTRFLRIMRELCFRTVFVAGIRPAHLYRILASFKSGVTMVFEEFNLNDAKSDSREYIDMLNAGNQKDTFVPRMSGHQFQDIEWLPLFSPKILTTTNDFINEGLIRRCFTGRVGLLPLPEEKIFESLPNEFYVRCADLRCKLLGWRFMKFGQPVNADAAKYRQGVDIGIWQNFFPTVAMIPAVRKDAIDMVISLAVQQVEDLETSQTSSDTARVLESAYFVADVEKMRAWTQDILEHVVEFDTRGGWTLSRVRQSIRETGLQIKRSAKIIGDRKKFDFFIDLDEAFLTCLERHNLGRTLDGAERGIGSKNDAAAKIM